MKNYQCPTFTQSDYDDIRADTLRGPRLTSLLNIFEEIASGNVQAPKKLVLADFNFLKINEKYIKFHEIFQKNIGTFYKHFCASIPYIIEEHCRLGVALLELFQEESFRENIGRLALYEIGGADGSFGRTLTECAQGLVVSLSDTPNKANSENFKRLCNHNYSAIHVGPFVDITPKLLKRRNEDSNFPRKFDVIYENTTFQMYNINRLRQIAYAKRVLNSEGIFIFLEKVFHPVKAEYDRREHLKDKYFKTKYFTEDQINSKKKHILTEMEKCQVTFDELVYAIKKHFSFVFMIWNSANFYELAASNNRDRIERFIIKLGNAHVPDQFACENPMVKEL